MLSKGLVVTVLAASTSLAFVGPQEPKPTVAPVAPAATARPAEQPQQQSQQQQQPSQQERQALQRARAELQQAQLELRQLRQQLDGALDQLDRQLEPQRERNCAPSRGRQLMSHYQWLREQGHAQRAAGALAKVVEQVGDDPHRLQHTAQELMTEKETAGRFDELALALVQRLEQRGDAQHPQQLDTMALAHFLNGGIQRAIVLQRQAIERGGRGDEYRLRLRTYEAAQAALAKVQGDAVAAEPKLVAGGDD